MILLIVVVSLAVAFLVFAIRDTGGNPVSTSYGQGTTCRPLTDKERAEFFTISNKYAAIRMAKLEQGEDAA